VPGNIDRLPVDLGGVLHLREVVDERGVDHAVGCVRAAAQGLQVLQRSAPHLGAGGLDRFRGGV
jgi:hypothetical protein